MCSQLGCDDRIAVTRSYFRFQPHSAFIFAVSGSPGHAAEVCPLGLASTVQAQYAVSQSNSYLLPSVQPVQSKTHVVPTVDEAFLVHATGVEVSAGPALSLLLLLQPLTDTESAMESAMESDEARRESRGILPRRACGGTIQSKCATRSTFVASCDVRSVACNSREHRLSANGSRALDETSTCRDFLAGTKAAGAPDMSTAPLTAQPGSVPCPPIAFVPEYEFDDDQNRVFHGLGRSLRLLGIITMVNGGFALLGVFGGPFVALIAVATAVLYLVNGQWLRSSGENMKRIVGSQGNDISYLMTAMSQLRRVFLVQVILAIFPIVSGLFGLAGLLGIHLLSFG